MLWCFFPLSDLQVFTQYLDIVAISHHVLGTITTDFKMMDVTVTVSSKTAFHGGRWEGGGQAGRLLSELLRKLVLICYF